MNPLTAPVTVCHAWLVALNAADALLIDQTAPANPITPVAATLNARPCSSTNETRPTRLLVVATVAGSSFWPSSPCRSENSAFSTRCWLASPPDVRAKSPCAVLVCSRIRA